MTFAVAQRLPLLVDLLDSIRLPLFDEAGITSHHKHDLLPQELILLLVPHSQLGLLDIVDDPLVVVRTTDVPLEVTRDTRDLRVFIELDRVVVEEVEQPEVGHLLLALGEVLLPDGDCMHELHIALTFLYDD